MFIDDRYAHIGNSYLIGNHEFFTSEETNSSNILDQNYSVVRLRKRANQSIHQQNLRRNSALPAIGERTGNLGDMSHKSGEISHQNYTFSRNQPSIHQLHRRSTTKTLTNTSGINFIEANSPRSTIHTYSNFYDSPDKSARNSEFRKQRFSSSSSGGKRDKKFERCYSTSQAWTGQTPPNIGITYSDSIGRLQSPYEPAINNSSSNKYNLTPYNENKNVTGILYRKDSLTPHDYDDVSRHNSVIHQKYSPTMSFNNLTPGGYSTNSNYPNSPCSFGEQSPYPRSELTFGETPSVHSFRARFLCPVLNFRLVTSSNLQKLEIQDPKIKYLPLFL